VSFGDHCQEDAHGHFPATQPRQSDPPKPSPVTRESTHHHQGLPPSQLNVAAVRSTPRARRVWHSHDGGQTPYITEGLGLAQVRGQQIV